MDRAGPDYDSLRQGEAGAGTQQVPRKGSAELHLQDSGHGRSGH
jgi:hypothetical protein